MAISEAEPTPVPEDNDQPLAGSLGSRELTRSQIFPDVLGD